MLLDRDTGKTQSTHGASCSCPACLSLQCLERPRYFSGQLLTEMDLNSEQEYILAKQRLHNRYLHGSGIVCGLQVSCSTCTGAVTIQSGYAIDPCGNDIIVCDTQDFNVIQRIHDCEKQRKRQRKSNCDPITPPRDANCRDIERHYCLTVAYTEQETRLSPTLRQGSTTNTCNGQGNGCGCNSNGKKKGCGCNNSSSSSSSSGSQYTNSMTQAMSSSSTSSSRQSSQGSQSSSAISCQPTRILEGYQIDVREVPPDCCGDAKAALEDTLLAKVIDCFTSIKGFLDRKLLPRNVYTVLTPLAFTGKVDDSVSWDDVYKYSCYLRQAIHELYVQDPLNTHCQAKDVLSQVICQPPPRKPDNEQAAAQARTMYMEQMRTTLYDLLALLMQYMLDCVCLALLPPCLPSPTDDRLILACMTVKDDQIIDICNFCHRRYAGSFPSLYYWLSLVPVIPLIAYAVERLCCYDWLKRGSSERQGEQQSSIFRGNLVNGLSSLLNSMDPSGNLRKEIFADSFAMPRSYAAKFEQLINKVSSPEKVADILHPEAFNLTKIIDKSVAEATTALQQAGVTPVVHAVASIDEVPILPHLATSPFAMAGDHIVLYNANDKVVGYATHTPSPDIEQVKNDVASLKENLAQVPQAADVSQLKSDVEALKGNAANAAQSSSLDEVKNDVETLKSNMANAVQQSNLETVKNDVETLKGSVANAAPSSALDAMRNDVETLKGNVANAAQSSTLDEVKNDVETLKGTLANAAQSSDLDAVKNDVEALKGSVANAAQSSALDPIKNDLEALKSGLAHAAQAAEVGQLRNDLAQFAQATDVNQLRGDVDGLKSGLANAAQSSDLETVKNDVEALKGSVGNAAQSSALDTVRNDVEALKGNVANAAQSSALDEVKNDVEALKGNVANAAQSSALDEVKSDIEALKGDMANVARAAEVSGIRDEVSGLKNEVDTLRDLQATIKALQDELATLRGEVDQLRSRDTGNTGETGSTPPAEPPQ